MPLPPGFALNPMTSTTIAVVAENAVMTKAEAQRLAIMAQDGLTWAIRPIHSPFDDDSVFVLATGRVPLARAVARGVFHAEGLGDRPGWKD